MSSTYQRARRARLQLKAQDSPLKRALPAGSCSRIFAKHQLPTLRTTPKKTLCAVSMLAAMLALKQIYANIVSVWELKVSARLASTFAKARALTFSPGDSSCGLPKHCQGYTSQDAVGSLQPATFSSQPVGSPEKANPGLLEPPSPEFAAWCSRNFTALSMVCELTSS